MNETTSSQPTCCRIGKFQNDLLLSTLPLCVREVEGEKNAVTLPPIWTKSLILSTWILAILSIGNSMKACYHTITNECTIW